MSKTLVTAALIGLIAVTAHADGDSSKGEKVFRRCKACHAVGDGAKSKVGPVLNGVIGRTAGGMDGFSYSDAMIAAGEGGLIWDDETLAAFLKKPKDLVDGTKMSFAGLRKEDDILNLIAYLHSFSE